MLLKSKERMFFLCWGTDRAQGHWLNTVQPKDHEGLIFSCPSLLSENLPQNPMQT